MQQNSLQQSPIPAALARSIVLLVANGVTVFIILSSALSEIASSGGLFGQGLFLRLIPGLSLLTAFAGSVLAYVTMGLVSPTKVGLYQGVSAVLFALTLVLLLTKVFGPLFGLA